MDPLKLEGDPTPVLEGPCSIPGAKRVLSGGYSLDRPNRGQSLGRVLAEEFGLRASVPELETPGQLKLHHNKLWRTQRQPAGLDERLGHALVVQLHHFQQRRGDCLARSSSSGASRLPR